MTTSTSARPAARARRRLLAAFAAALALLLIATPTQVSPAGAAPRAAGAANQPPSVVITSPVAGTTARSNARYVLTATATDPEDGVLPASALHWDVVVRGGPRDGTVVLADKTGNDLSLNGLTTTRLDDMAAGVRQEIRVTVTDSAGATATATRDLPMQSVPVTLTTSPPGISMTVLGKTVTTPVTFPSWVGQKLYLSTVPSVIDGRLYGLDAWADGTAVATSRTLVTPATPLTLASTWSLRGLQARYFDTPNLSGPSIDRWDPEIHATWGYDAPLPGMGADDFSVRWTGQIIPKVTGAYAITVNADAGARMWLDGTLLFDKFSGGSGMQYLSAYPTLTAGVPAAVVVEARGGSGSSEATLYWSSLGSDDVSGWVPFEAFRPRYAFNFQPAGAPVPPGHLADTGATYAPQGGLRYGWSADRRSWTRDREVLIAKPSDQLRDTFVHLRDAVWELELPRGTYKVTAVSGDPRYTDSVHRIDAEGVRLLDGVPSVTNRFVTGSVVVPVTDGRLTLTTGAGGSNVKLNAVTVEMQ